MKRGDGGGKTILCIFTATRVNSCGVHREGEGEGGKQDRFSNFLYSSRSSEEEERLKEERAWKRGGNWSTRESIFPFFSGVKNIKPSTIFR